MSIYSPSRSVPPEIWLQIFQTATFIPGEWDVSATTSHPGLFTSWDTIQLTAHRGVLPLRRAIVQVSRLWWQIGSEVLYASFHETTYYYFSHSHSLDHFERSLLSRPALGCHIKRLALQWPHKGSPSKIDHILQLCPNTQILSFYREEDPDLRAPWKPRILVNHVRFFDADVYGFSQKCIVHMLSSLPNVEVLHLTGLCAGDEESRYHGSLRLPLVHFLSLSSYGVEEVDEGFEYWTPLLSTADIPRLTSLSTDLGGASLPFSIDVWQRITFFNLFLGACSALKPEIFRSLTHLQLELKAKPLRHQQSHFPFHQLTHLTILYHSVQHCVSQWKQNVEVFLALEMPLLRVIELGWGKYGISDSHNLARGQGRYVEVFLDYLESSAHKFEQVGIQFQEVYTEDIYRVPIPIKDVIKSTRDGMAIRL